MSASKKLYLSSSGVNLFLDCPLAHRLKYVDKIKLPYFKNEYTVFGSAIHKALEFNFKQKIKSRRDLGFKDVEHVFNTDFIDEASTLKSTRTDLKKLMDQGQDMLYHYMKTMAPKYQPIAVEEYFEIDLKSYDFGIRGYIDLITEDGLIIDHKTVGSTSYQKRTQSHVDNIIQLTMYSLAFRKLYGKNEKGVGIDLLKRLKSGTKFASVLSTRSDSQIMSLVTLANRISQMHANGMFYGNLNHCKNCELSKFCNKMSI